MGKDIFLIERVRILKLFLYLELVKQYIETSFEQKNIYIRVESSVLF